jgi:hypothetical protein
MIPFSAALAEEYWEPRLVLPSEQRQVVGLEPLSGRRSEGQRGYLGVSLLHLRRHRAPITATQPTGMATQATDIPLTGILLMDIRDTQPIRNRAMDIRDTRGLPVTPVPRLLDIKAALGNPATPARPTTDTPATRIILLSPVRRATNTTAMPDTPLNPVPRATDIKAARHTLPILVPVTDILCMTIPATTLRGIGLLGPNTRSNLLAEDLQLILRCETG